MRKYKQKINLKADLTGVVNKTYDDGLKRPIQSVSDITTTFLDFVRYNMLYSVKKQNEIMKVKYEKFANELEMDAKKIPPENLISAKENIAVPVIEKLRYNFDVEEIKNMFKNILLSDIDKNKQDKVLPSYVSIVEQLSVDDAKFLKYLKENKLTLNVPIVRLKTTNNDGSTFTYLTGYFILFNNGESKAIDKYVMDNLMRLRIIDIPFGLELQDISKYEPAEKKLIENVQMVHPYLKLTKLACSQYVLNFTDFGLNFLDVVL
jgi:hypothetical protein